MITVATLTTENLNKISPFEILATNSKENGLDYPSKIILSYTFSLNKELRLIECLGKVNKETMNKVKIALKITFDLEV